MIYVVWIWAAPLFRFVLVEPGRWITGLEAVVSTGTVGTNTYPRVYPRSVSEAWRCTYSYSQWCFSVRCFKIMACLRLIGESDMYSCQARSAALADLARLRSCAGSLASAWLTAWPGPAELTAVEFCISARLRLGEDLFAGQDGDDACAADPLQPVAPTPSYAARCGTQWWLAITR